MPDKPDKPSKERQTPEGDRLTIPESPVAKKESQPSMPAVKAEAVDEARLKAEAALRAERENKAHAMTGHVMGLSRLRHWADIDGNEVGMVDPDGKPLRQDIKNSLLRTGMLVHADDIESLPDDVFAKLEEAAALIPAEMCQSVSASLKPIEDKLQVIKETIADLEHNPDYLLDFKLGGKLRDDITEVLHAMNDTRPVWKTALANNPWVILNNAAQYFSTLKDVSQKRYEMDTAQQKKFGEDTPHVSEFAARTELNEEARVRLRELAENDGDQMEMAGRMSALMGDQLHAMFNSVSGQLTFAFDDQDFEIGDTDAQSMLSVIDSLNKCLETLREIRKTKKHIPTLD